MTEECCPLCMEELDPTDRNFNACSCGYQVCLWCWHQIKNEYNGRCPACRSPYLELNKQSCDVDEVVRKTKLLKSKSLKSTVKKSNAMSHQAIVNSRKCLTNMRVVQRNLVYAIGLPLHFANEEKLKSLECFGQYGKIVKVVVNKSHGSNGTASAYATYFDKMDAQRAIDVLDGYVLDGRMIRASFGTTKYCNFFLRNLACGNPDCLYLHELGQEEDSFTKEEMQTGKTSFRDSVPPLKNSGNGFPLSLPDESEKGKTSNVVNGSMANGNSAGTGNRTSANGKKGNETGNDTGAVKKKGAAETNGAKKTADMARKATSAAAVNRLRLNVEPKQDGLWNTLNGDNSTRKKTPKSPPGNLKRNSIGVPPFSSFTKHDTRLDKWDHSKDASLDHESSVDEVLANMLGAQFTGKLAAEARQRERKSSSRFAFANDDEDNAKSNSNSSSKGLAFLQQMLPNAHISYGASEQTNWDNTTTYSQNRSQNVQDPAILTQGSLCFDQKPPSSKQ